MKRDLFITNDGSHSIMVPDLNLSYHSKHGAIAESVHVFIQAGWDYIVPTIQQNTITVFEMGLGTGLNALLTLIKSENQAIKTHYISLEAEPIDTAFITALNYCQQLERPDLQGVFEKLHSCEWNKDNEIIPNFIFKKIQASLLHGVPAQNIQLLYFDAFAPEAQPELWTENVFRELYQQMNPEGILVTYCSKSIVRKAMMAAGFTVTKIPGPRGKREMVRAIRNAE